MSLDITLTDNETEVFSCNITHNLAAMAIHAGIYDALWRPAKHDIYTAVDLIPPLQRGIAHMVMCPEKFEEDNAQNGWGKYEDFLPWLVTLFQECRKHPSASISVSI